uniref:Peptidase n=1 Tax=viral metagenome TaxID=1070528 RepID=A0A6M3LK27_9ZZZZ
MESEGMLVKVKDGVCFSEINFYLFLCCYMVSNVFRENGVVPTITSACDGRHKEGSLHYKGLAWDWRIWGLYYPEVVAWQIRERLQGVDKNYDVVYGDKDHLDHIHIEYDLKKKSIKKGGEKK